MNLHLGRVVETGAEFTLPVDVATEKLAMLGRTGSGKTYGGTKLAEEMLDAGVQIIAIDPVGVWRGLRIGAKFEIYVFGGLGGDFPLEPTGGALLADVIVDRGISAVLDVSQFETDADKGRFCAAFAERFYFRKKTERSAVHLFIEEAQEFVPQNPDAGETMMLHRFQRIWKLGRNFGIGGTLITQRPQEVNKKVLNQAGRLFVFQLTGPQERKTVADWIADKGISAGDVKAMLPAIKVGQPHIWSAGSGEGFTVKIAAKKSADISSTPKVGERVETRKLTPIDAARIRSEMAAAIERAKESDPAALRAEIARLKKEVARPPAPAAPVKVADPALLGELEANQRLFRLLVDRINRERKNAESTWASLSECVANFQQVISKLRVTRGRDPAAATPPATAVKQQRAEPAAPGAPDDRAKISAGMRRMMIALAQKPGLTKAQIGVRAGLSSRSGTFDTYMSRLRSNGWIDGDGNFALTSEGLRALGPYDPLPTGRKLFEYWLADFGSNGAGRILSVLVEAYPRGLTKEEIGAAANISHASGTFDTYLSRLRSLELAQGKKEIKASDELFE